MSSTAGVRDGLGDDSDSRRRHYLARVCTCFDNRFDNPDLELRQLQDKKSRIMPLTIGTCVFYCFIVIIQWIIPSDAVPTWVWLFYRTNNAASALWFVIFTAGHYFDWLDFASFDLQASLIGVHWLAYQSLTVNHMEKLLGGQPSRPAHDEAYQLIICFSFWSAVVCRTELRLWHQLALLHIHIIIWVGLGVHFGTPEETKGLWLKMTAAYYLIVLLLIQLNCRAERTSREMFVLRKRLERQVVQERALAKDEREAAMAKVSAAEQAALRSFMAAVFDTFGHLHWVRTGVNEPKLCFTSPGKFLNALMKQDMSGRPLDALLGKAPAHGEARDRWHHERQRLWTYAALEAAPQHEEEEQAEEQSKVLKVARKLTFTCTNATGNTFEAELFLRPGSEGRTLFGLLLLTRGDEIKLLSESNPDVFALETPIVSMMVRARTVGNSAFETTSCYSVSEDGSSADNAEVSTWVDAALDDLPVVVSSSTFSWLSRHEDGENVKLMDIVSGKHAFESWFRHCLSSWVNGEEQVLNPSFWHKVCLCPAASSRSFVEINSLCKFVSADIFEFERATAGRYKKVRIPVKLTFTSLTMKAKVPARGKSCFPDIDARPILCL
eukprot:TRINITY_DN12409_c0_g1_i1.p1 TRINITY_DN12409_c0_g1~~TRINITY_DN12409_c0_g1_i1.p1  ORF type:complete len:609 (+),score=90.90 TRINITY_DN12409_c0_g1_i1:142-1968(+)